MNRNDRSKWTMIIYCLCGLCLMAGCDGGGEEEFFIPDDDSTPPIVSMLMPGNPAYEVSSEDNQDLEVEVDVDRGYMAVQASARDSDGGVKRVEVSYTASCICVNSRTGGGELYDIDLGQAVDEEEQELGVGDPARIVRAASLKIPRTGNFEEVLISCKNLFPDVGCDKKLGFRAVVQAEGENFSGETIKSPKIDFTVLRQNP